MSTTISVSLYTEATSIAEAYVSLLHRFLERSEVKSVSLHEKHFDTNVSHPENWESSLNDLAKSLPESKNRLDFELLYKLN